MEWRKGRALEVSPVPKPEAASCTIECRGVQDPIAPFTFLGTAASSQENMRRSGWLIGIKVDRETERIRRAELKRAGGRPPRRRSAF